MYSTGEVPVVDLSERPLGVEDVSAYRREGVLVVRGLLSEPELADLDAASRRLIRTAWDSPGARDFVSASFGGHADPIPFKVDYVLDKDPAFRVLAGHPRLLALAAAIVGPTFVPTWETLVFKDRLAGPRIPWHRDCAVYDSSVAVGGAGRLVDAGVYLDEATEDNCLRCVPGSCYWADDRAADAIEMLNEAWDDHPGVLVPVQPGDAVLHNVLTLHSAPETTGSERRVVYYEYRPAEVEIALGPHSADYVAEKQRVLRACLEERRASPVAEGETAFAYAPPAELERWREASPDGGFRVAHSDYWTWPDVEPEPR